MKPFLSLLLCLLLTAPLLHAQDVLYRSDTFEVTDTAVREGDYEAVADAPTRLRSNYLYASALAPRLLTFKFALNGQDNEAPPGQDHALYLMPEDGRLVTPVYTFGEVDPAGPPPSLERPVQGAFDVTFRLDLRPVLAAFEQEGRFVPAHGRPIAAEDFRGVYIAGSENPLSWDFNALGEHHRLTDPDGDGIYEATLSFELGGTRPFDDDGYAVWTLREDVSGLPRYHSEQPLVDALYNLSLEELQQDIRADGAFMAGAKWTGVWTRDISYSILLALAMVDPAASQQSLMAKVQDGHIIQDTGTGGSWPVSTDRMTWALAAWEVYRVTGDDAWLRTAYDLIRRSAEADLLTARDPETGLFYGESSFLDWREQSYPRWMDPKDIYRSQNLGTNAVHYATYRILAQMAERLGEPAARWQGVADTIRTAMNAYLWQPEAGYYGQFRYGRSAYALSPRAEALGTALTVLFDIASPAQAERMLARFPLVPYGVPTLYPQTPGITPYHNDSIWPFVAAYWTWAGARGGNSAAVEHGLASIYRAAALFLTNKENLVAETGHFAGTAINSDRQLWSVAGNLATVYRVFFGMQFEPDRLVFQPFVPEAYAGRRTLTGLRYRDAVLDVTVEGYGDAVASATLDGRPVDAAVIPAELTGRHTLVLTLDGTLPRSTATVVPVRYAPATPQARLDGTLAWDAVDGAVAYEVYRNGDPVATATATTYAPGPADGLAVYQVRAVDALGQTSFLSEPLRQVAAGAVQVVEPAAMLETAQAGFEGAGYLRLTRADHTDVAVTVAVPEAGRYLVEARYANGSGPVNTDNKAAIRTLSVDGARVGALVMPQRGDGLWNDWGYSNPVPVYLTAGTHTLRLRFTVADENMNGEVNTALLDHLRLVRVR